MTTPPTDSTAVAPTSGRALVTIIGADRVGIIARGNLVAEGTPESLKGRVGNPTVHIEMSDPGDAGRACAAPTRRMSSVPR